MNKLMGILNVTPDSFSDGGLFQQVEQAVAHGLQLAVDGASIIDVGGESTRPGADRVDAAEQIRRVEPVIFQLRQSLDSNQFNHVQISIDTTRVRVAELAVKAGASFINDISAGLEEPEIIDLAAELNIDLCLMHKQGVPKTMQDQPLYHDVQKEVFEFLLNRTEVAHAKGLKPEQCFLDPGIGFGKSFQDNHVLINSLSHLKSTGYNVLLGVSRKRFLRKLVNDVTKESNNDLLDIASTGIALKTIPFVDVFRVHNVLLHQMMLHIHASVNET